MEKDHLLNVIGQGTSLIGFSSWNSHACLSQSFCINWERIHYDSPQPGNHSEM
jgi:hypothetical protein